MVAAGEITTVNGACLCGAVSFELDKAGIVLSVGCFCSNCRKVSGSQSGVYLQVRQRNFRWLSGQDNVASYESSPGNRRGFCRTCGCVAPIATAYGAIRVPGGALNGDPGVTPDVILFAADSAGWCATEAAQKIFQDAGPAEFWRKTIIQLMS